MTLIPDTLAPGQEQHEIYRASGRMGKPGPKRCQYDYRHTTGELFSCDAKSLAEARTRRDKWVAAKTMTDGEYAAARDGGLDICPQCRSRTVIATGSLEWSIDGDLATYPLECEECGNLWTEILRPVGYEPEED